MLVTALYMKSFLNNDLQLLLQQCLNSYSGLFPFMYIYLSRALPSLPFLFIFFCNRFLPLRYPVLCLCFFFSFCFKVSTWKLWIYVLYHNYYCCTRLRCSLWTSDAFEYFQIPDFWLWLFDFCRVPESQQRVAACYLNLMNQIKNLYLTYCSSHPSAVSILTDHRSASAAKTIKYASVFIHSQWQILIFVLV